MSLHAHASRGARMRDREKYKTPEHTAISKQTKKKKHTQKNVDGFLSILNANIMDSSWSGQTASVRGEFTCANNTFRTV